MAIEHRIAKTRIARTDNGKIDVGRREDQRLACVDGLPDSHDGRSHVNAVERQAKQAIAARARSTGNTSLPVNSFYRALFLPSSSAAPLVAPKEMIETPGRHSAVCAAAQHISPEYAKAAKDIRFFRNSVDRRGDLQIPAFYVHWRLYSGAG